MCVCVVQTNTISFLVNSSLFYLLNYTTAVLFEHKNDTTKESERFKTTITRGVHVCNSCMHLHVPGVREMHGRMQPK